MNKYLCWLAMVALAVACTGCIRCSCDDGTVDMEVTLTCSNDLLGFVTPTLQYVDERGDKQSVVLTESELRPSGDDMMSWRMRLHFESINVSREFKVTYSLKDGVEKLMYTYMFTHMLGCSVDVEKAHGKTETYQHVSADAPSAFVAKDNVDAYLNELIAKPQTLYVRVDTKNQVTCTFE